MSKTTGSMALVIAFLAVACSSGEGGTTTLSSEPDATQTTEGPSDTTAAPDTTEATATEWKDGVPCPTEGTVVGYSPLTLEFVWFADVLAAMEEEAAKCGVTVLSNDPTNDAEAQVNGIDVMLESGAAAIATVTVDPDALRPTVDEARGNGVLFVRHTGDLEGYDAAVGVPETIFGTLIGEVGGEWLIATKPDKESYKLAILNSDSLGPSLLERKAGLLTGFEGVVGDTPYEVVADVEAYTEQDAVDAVTAILTANPDIDLILTINDEGALGGLAAIENAGLTPNVDIAIVGSLLERGLQNVVDGKMPGGITLPGKDHGMGIIEAMFRLIAGENEGYLLEIPPLKLGNDPVEAQRRLDEGEY